MGKPDDPTWASDPPFHAVADTIALGMAFRILVPPDGSTRRFVYLSDSCLALNGVPAEAALADPMALYGLILPEHRERMQAAEAEALAACTPFDIEVPMRLPDGEVRWRRIASAPRMLEDGSTLWDGIQIDITKAKRVEFELEEQRRRMALAVEATGLGFWEWDVRSDRLNPSHRARTLLGLPREGEMDISAYVAVVHPDDHDKVRDSYRQARDQGDGGDYCVEYRVGDPANPRWLLTHGRIISDEAGPAVVVGTTIDVTERHAAEEARDLTLGELAHRAKNGLAIVMALVQQTARGATSLDGFTTLLTARLQAMADAQGLVTDAGGRPARLLDLAQAVLKPFDAARFDFDPELADVSLTNDLALALGLLIHEMATNALKYGSLSNPAGRVAIRRLGAPAGQVHVEWRETGGPPVQHTNGQGFGSRLLQAALRNQGGKVEARFEPAGFEAVLEFPAAA